MAGPLIAKAVENLWTDNAEIVDEALATEAKVRVTISVKIKYDDIGRARLTVELAHTKRHVAQVVSVVHDAAQLPLGIEEQNVPENLTPETV